MPFRELLFDIAGGIRDDRKLKFFIPGGASSQWLIGSDEHLDAPLDMDFVQQTFGVMLGSGAVMVYDETVDPVLVAWRLAKFFAHESCGKCTPCREGTGWLEKILYRMSHGEGRPEDLALLFDVGDNISPGVTSAPFVQTTICPLGPSAVSPVASLHKYFREEIEARYRAGAAVS
jgi:NADH-quinone oxidoreductase subunit F